MSMHQLFSTPPGLWARALLVFVCISLSACHGGYTGPEEGPPFEDSGVTLYVAAAPSEAYDEVSLHVSQVVFYRNDGAEVRVPVSDQGKPVPEGKAVPLQLASAERTATKLLDFQVFEPASYDGLYLVLKAERGVVDSFVQQKGLIHDLEIATDTPQLLRIAYPFHFQKGGSQSWAIELNLRKDLRLVDAVYRLNPSARVVDFNAMGGISGQVAAERIAADCSDSQAGAIYAFHGEVAPDDYDGSGAQAFTSAIVSVSDRQYTLLWLSAGSYTLAWTCDANRDKPDSDEVLRFHGRQLVQLAQGEYRNIHF